MKQKQTLDFRSRIVKMENISSDDNAIFCNLHWSRFKDIPFTNLKTGRKEWKKNIF